MARPHDPPIRKIQTMAWFHFIKNFVEGESVADTLLKLGLISDKPADQRNNDEKALVRAAETWHKGQKAIADSNLIRVNKRLPKPIRVEAARLFHNGPDGLFSVMRFVDDMGTSPQLRDEVPERRLISLGAVESLEEILERQDTLPPRAWNLSELAEATMAWFNAFRMLSIGWILTNHNSIYAFRPNGSTSGARHVFMSEIGQFGDKSYDYFSYCHQDLMHEIDSSASSLSNLGISPEFFLYIVKEQARHEAIKHYPDLRHSLHMRSRGCEDLRIKDLLELALESGEGVSPWVWPSDDR